MAALNGIKCGLDYSSTPMCLLTWYASHATTRKITYDWVRCLLT